MLAERQPKVRLALPVLLERQAGVQVVGEAVGTTDEAIAMGMPLLYFAFTVLLVRLAFVGRRSPLQIR